MSWWPHIWNRVKAVPVGVWAALGAALTILFMFLRGRRLEAELARESIKALAAVAAAQSARSEGSAEAHMGRAAVHATRAIELEEARATLLDQDKVEQKRIAAMPPSQVTSEFLKLAARKKVSGG